jgi:protein-L-isoaspartate(D-aspartate) O-methyltransferase
MRRVSSLALAGVLMLAGAGGALAAFADARSQMVQQVSKRTEATAQVTGVTEIAPRILDALDRVPRHQFVPDKLRRFAYLPTPLPLGHGQNIASPYIVALMTHLAAVDDGARVLETGTGAGYHAAVLTELGADVVSVEVIEPIANSARVNLAETGHAEVETHIGDGYYGWPKGAPYDAILVKEALDHVPEPLVGQLKPGGRLVLPLGPLDGRQALTVVTKTGEGETERRRVLPVRFSPLQGGQRL